MTSAIPGELNADQEQERKRKKRGAIIKFSLAGVALLGIGAAATSAAWTDDAWFKGNATAADVNLQGSIDNSDFESADDSTHSLTFDVDHSLLGTLNQGSTVSVPLYLYNPGHQALTLTSNVVADTGVFATIAAPSDSPTGNGAPATAKLSSTPGTVTALPSTIASTDHLEVYLIVATPADWSKDFRGKTGDITVTFTGK